VLKQDLNQPLPLEDQVMIIYTATNGHLDDLEVSEVKAFERAFYPFLHDRYPELGIQISQTRDFTKDQQETLTRAIHEFKATWRK